MSIQQVQTKNVLDVIAQSLYANGKHPLLRDIMIPLNTFFAENPTGSPYKLPTGRFREGLIGSQEDYNDLAAFMIANLDTLYEVCFDHIDQVMMLNTALQNHLDRLKKKRARLEDKIDDYLLGIYNSDGYFYSISDSFNEAGLVDFNYTNTYVDTESGVVILPSQTSGTRLVHTDKLSDPTIVIKNNQDKTYSYDTKLPFANAVDGLTNTAWFVEVRTKDPGPLTLGLQMELSTALGATKISKIELTPYGVEPVKVGIEASYIESSQNVFKKPFSNNIKTSTNKMLFIAEDIDLNMETVFISMNKMKRDYQVTDHDGTFNVFVFGIKELLLSESIFDTQATMVTQPLSIPTALSGETAIDGVSLTIEADAPAGTGIKYYVAENIPDAESLADFDWRQLNPIGWSSDASKNTIVKFGGSKSKTKIYRRQPRDGSENKVFDFNTTDPDLAKRNPTGAFFSGIDVYRIGSFVDSFLSGTLTLEEGINTTKIYYTDLDAFAIIDDFTFWKEVFDSKNYSTTYGHIDTGNGFFYGGDVGSNGKSVYCETYVNIEEEMSVVQKECRKTDPNSQLWNVKLYLNGREIANLPPGTNKATVPWKFNKGRNHVVMMANIPAATSGYSPYVGVFEIMTGNDTIMDYGDVNLDYLDYVDNHKLINNQLNDARSFTIYNNELVTRRKPTNNYRIRYHQNTDVGPSAIRLRADLTRAVNSPTLTPVLDSYRVRFSYESD